MESCAKEFLNLSKGTAISFPLGYEGEFVHGYLLNCWRDENGKIFVSAKSVKGDGVAYCATLPENTLTSIGNWSDGED